MRKEKKIFWLVLASFFLLQYVTGAYVNASVTTSSDTILVEEDYSMVKEATDAKISGNINVDQTAPRIIQENLTRTIQGGGQMLQLYSGSNSASFSRHLMCKEVKTEWNGSAFVFNPIDPTTTFRPSDAFAMILTTVFINDTMEFRWFYRSNSSKTWVSAYNYSLPASNPGSYREYQYRAWLNISGFWPGYHYPRAYKVDVHLDGSFSPSFSEFFDVTNGGLNSPRVGEGVDTNGRAVNMKSRFTIGVDTEAHHSLRFDRVAYFNEELGYCHNFTTVWIQPNGSTYRRYSGNFADYKDVNVTWNYWEYNYTLNDYIPVDTSTPVGNWTVEVYLDSYFNNTWKPYGPVATTPFIVGNETVADWTFMVYLDADNNLEEAGIDIFEKMASVGSTSQVNVVVQMDRTPGHDNRYLLWTDAKRFNLTKDMWPTPGNATEPLGEKNMGDPDTLKDFVNWTINNYPANYYFLALWNHGAGHVGLCFDNYTPTPIVDFLSIPELSQALSGLSAIMDVVLLDACAMSMTEVAYQIKDYANVLAAPEGLGYSPAPYDDYLSSLTSNSSMLPNEFAAEVVTQYINWCNSQPVEDIPNAAMAATDLTEFTGLMAAIDDFALELKEKETSYLSRLLDTHEQIILSRNQTEGYQGPYAGQIGYYIDLYHFAQLTNQSVPDEELRNAADQVMTTLEGIIIIEADKARPDSHGLSIFFPDEKGKYEDYESEYEETTFAEDNLWDEFVKYHLSGHILTIETLYTEVRVEIVGKSNTTDAYGTIRVFVSPDYYTVNVTTPIYNITGPNSREIFIQWNDNNMSNPRTLFVNRTLTLKAEYKTQYYLTMSTNFGKVNPSSCWHDAGSTVQIDASALNVVDGERYLWLGWTGTGDGSCSSTDNPASITIDGPINETAAWRHEYYLTVTSLYGSPTPASGWLEAGKPINASVTSPVSESVGTRYVFTGWTGTGSVSTSGTTIPVTFTINASSSIAWNWKTQYLLTVRTDPTGIGPQPNISPLGPWYDDGTPVNCTAQRISGRAFDHWTVDGTSWDPGVYKITVAMEGPHEATAHYVRAGAWWETLLSPEILNLIIALVGVALPVALLGTAWVKTRRKRAVVKDLSNTIDEVYSRFKMNPRECEEELCRLRDKILEDLTDGKITQENYDIMDKRIEKYIDELREKTARKNT